jgi:hypothetical protein
MALKDDYKGSRVAHILVVADRQIRTLDNQSKDVVRNSQIINRIDREGLCRRSPQKRSMY